MCSYVWKVVRFLLCWEKVIKPSCACCVVLTSTAFLWKSFQNWRTLTTTVGTPEETRTSPGVTPPDFTYAGSIALFLNVGKQSQHQVRRLMRLQYNFYKWVCERWPQIGLWATYKTITHALTYLADFPPTVSHSDDATANQTRPPPSSNYYTVSSLLHVCHRYRLDCTCSRSLPHHCHPQLPQAGEANEKP